MFVIFELKLKNVCQSDISKSKKCEYLAEEGDHGALLRGEEVTENFNALHLLGQSG